MPEPSIKSRPVYGTLQPRPGVLHLFVADGEGASAILDLAAKASPAFFGKAHIIYIPDSGSSRNVGEALRALHPDSFYEGPSVAAALPRLAQALSTARMGTRAPPVRGRARESRRSGVGVPVAPVGGVRRAPRRGWARTARRRSAGSTTR